MRRTLLLGAAAALALAVLPACGNPCQQLCSELLNYAEDTCGLPVEPGDRNECRSRNSGIDNPDDLDACRWGLERIPVEVDGKEVKVARVRVEWTCDEVETNVLGGNAGDDDSSAE